MTRLLPGHEARGARPRLVEVGALCILLLAQLFLYSRTIHAPTNYDEDVYLAAVDALRHGQVLGSQVFAAELPGFYDLLRGLSYVAGIGVVNLRAALLAVVSLGTIGGWLVGRRVGGPIGGLLVPAMLTIAPPLDLFSSQVIADTPCLSLMLLSLGLSTLSGTAAAFSAGAVLGAALTVKPTALIVLPALAWFIRRRWLPALVGAVAVSAVELIAHAGALSALWGSNVVYHDRATSTRSVIPDPHMQILRQIPKTTPFFVLAVLACLVTIIAAPKILSRLWPLWLTVALSLVLLLTYRPLHYNHLIVFPFTLAVAAGATLGAALDRLPGHFRRTAGAAVLAIVIAAGWVQQLHRVDEVPSSQPSSVVNAAKALRHLTQPSDLIADDQPIISFLAHRRVVGALVDTAFLRFETRSLTDASVIRDLKPAAAVVVSRSLRSRPNVLAFLHDHDRLAYDAGGVRIYVHP